jgi:flagellar motor protein MotB
MLGLLVATALACGGLVAFLYSQLRESEAASARAAARSAELERSGQALKTKVEGMERREQGLTALLDELGARQRARDAAAAERSNTFDSVATLVQPLVKRGDASVGEEADGVDVHLSERALFLGSTSLLSLSGARLLRQLGTTLPDGQWRIEVTGRGPSLLVGSLELSAEHARLAAARASVVSAYFIRQVGLRAERVSAAVYGPIRPRPGEPSPARRSSIEVRLVAPVVDFDRPGTTTASTGRLPAGRP